MRGVYSALSSPMLSLPVIGCRPRGRTGLKAAYETAWITNRSACVKRCGARAPSHAGATRARQKWLRGTRLTLGAWRSFRRNFASSKQHRSMIRSLRELSFNRRAFRQIARYWLELFRKLKCKEIKPTMTPTPIFSQLYSSTDASRLRRADRRRAGSNPHQLPRADPAIASSRSASSSQPPGQSRFKITTCSLALSSWPVST